MPISNYAKGRAKEYKIMKRLKKQNYDVVLRSAGSHSPIDVMGIDTKNRIIVFIQSKPKNFSKKRKEKISSDMRKLNGTFITRFYVE